MTTPRRRIAPCIATLLLTTTAALHGAPAGATGFVIPENGTKAVGGGGGYVLGATGPEVIYFNPALLTRLKGLQLTFDLNLHHLDATFQRAGTYPTPPAGQTDVPYPAIENEYEGPLGIGFFPAPMLFVSHDFGLDDFGFGLAVYGPSAVGGRKFPSDGFMEGDGLAPNRYLLIEAEILEIYYTLAGAWQYEGFRVGASLQLAHLIPKFKLAIHGDNATMPDDENPQFQAINTLETSGFAPTGILGVAYDVSPALSFGLTFQKGPDFDTEGTVNLEFPEAISFLNPQLTDDGARFEVSEADVLRLGARYAFIDDAGRERFDVELVANWERWSRNKEFVITTEGDVQLGTSVVDLTPIRQPKQWKDAFSFRLGGDVAILDWLTGRVGGFYETSAIPKERTHLDFFSFDRSGFGLGTTLHLGTFDVDLAYLHILASTRNVEDGEVLMEAPINNNPRPVINNGKYTVSYDTISVGLTWRFGAGDHNAFTPAVNDLKSP